MGFDKFICGVLRATQYSMHGEDWRTSLRLDSGAIGNYCTTLHKNMDMKSVPVYMGVEWSEKKINVAFLNIQIKYVASGILVAVLLMLFFITENGIRVLEESNLYRMWDFVEVS